MIPLKNGPNGANRWERMTLSPRGAKVSHKEKHWISTVDSNVWEPGVYGWEESTDGV